MPVVKGLWLENMINVAVADIYKGYNGSSLGPEWNKD